MKNKDARSLPAEKQEQLRIRACTLIDNYKQIEVAEQLGVSRQIVGKWVKAYQKGGLNALRSKRRGRPILSKLQAAQINRLILDNTPDQLKLPFKLWSREAVMCGCQ